MSKGEFVRAGRLSWHYMTSKGVDVERSMICNQGVKDDDMEEALNDVDKAVKNGDMANN